MWDPMLHGSKIVQRLDQNTELFQYVTRGIGPLPQKDFCVIRWGYAMRSVEKRFLRILCGTWEHSNFSIFVFADRGKRTYRKTAAWWSRRPWNTKTPKWYPAVFEASYSPLVTSSSLAVLASLEFCIYPGSISSKWTVLLTIHSQCLKFQLFFIYIIFIIIYLQCVTRCGKPCLKSAIETTQQAKLWIFVKNEFRSDSGYLNSVAPLHFMNRSCNPIWPHEICKYKKRRINTVSKVGKNLGLS